jgi:membrane protein required for colicin V production
VGLQKERGISFYPMNYIDIIILLPLLWAAFRGFTKGFIIAAASLLALILGIYGGIHFSGYAANLLAPHFEADFKHLRVVSFLATFVVIVIAVHMVAWLTDKLVSAVALGFVNRILGILFNTVKMAFIISVLIGMLNYFDPNSSILDAADKEASITYKPVEALAPALFPYLRFDEILDRKPEKLTEALR